MLNQYVAKLISRERLAPNVYRFDFALVDPKELDFQAGQYLLMAIPDGYRQYSISSSPSRKHAVEMVVDTSPMGPGSKYLMNLEPGDEVSFRAPMGVFTLHDNTLPKVFMATGAGIAPVKSMISSLLEQEFSAPVQLLWGLRTLQDRYFDSFWQELKKTYHNFDYFYCLSRENQDLPQVFHGYVQDKLPDILPKTGKAAFYLCGRVETMDKLRNHLVENIGINPEQIYYEKFT